MMLGATQHFADPVTQERPFVWHAVELLGDASARSTCDELSRCNPLQLSSSTARARARFFWALVR